MAAAEPRVELVETALGQIEVARLGAGTPVLVMHGTPGGHDVGLATAGFLVNAGLEVIAPSRPGYLGTPLVWRQDIDAEADLMAALLDELGHERCNVLAWSGGGPAAYRLAIRHPNRVRSLAALNAISKAYEAGRNGSSDALMLRTTTMTWMLRLLAERSSREELLLGLVADSGLSQLELEELLETAMADIDRQGVASVAELALGRPRDQGGIENDLACFAAIESLGLEAIEASALIIGDAGDDVSADHNSYAAATIPRADRLVVGGNSDLCLLLHPDAPAVQARVVEMFTREDS